MSFEKQSINHASNVAVLNMFARFGFACIICGESDIRFITKEHYVAKSTFSHNTDSDLDNLYSACVACNQGKSNMLADSFFVGSKKTAIKLHILDSICRPVSGVERVEVIKAYANLILANARQGKSPAVVMMRFLVDTNVRKILGTLDFSGCFIQGNKSDVQNLIRYHDLTFAEIFINPSR